MFEHSARGIIQRGKGKVQRCKNFACDPALLELLDTKLGTRMRRKCLTMNFVPSTQIKEYIPIAPHTSLYDSSFLHSLPFLFSDEKLLNLHHPNFQRPFVDDQVPMSRLSRNLFWISYAIQMGLMIRGSTIWSAEGTFSRAALRRPRLDTTGFLSVRG